MSEPYRIKSFPTYATSCKFFLHFFFPNESLSKWLVLHLTHLFPGCRRVLLEPDERTAGAADPVPVPAGHPAAGGGLLRLAGSGHHLGDHKQHLEGRLPHPGGPQREGTVQYCRHTTNPNPSSHSFTSSLVVVRIQST